MHRITPCEVNGREQEERSDEQVYVPTHTGDRLQSSDTEHQHAYEPVHREDSLQRCARMMHCATTTAPGSACQGPGEAYTAPEPSGRVSMGETRR